MTQEELFKSARGRAQNAIRELFAEVGRVSISTLAQTAIDRGLIEDEALLQCQMRGLAELCRAALKRRTEEQLPFAQPISGAEDGEWAQLDLFSREELFGLIHARVAALAADNAELRLLRGFCLRKFGEAPEIPELLVPELADLMSK